ncbi:MAG: MBL fold metallo-hydrolase [Planctomycetes bacterium]|nr:MBL fold metallo-hydrolase [Planctomycetota bacterium]
MRPDRRPSPPLLRTALALCVGAGLPWPTEWVLALGALALLSGRPWRLLVVAGLVGHGLATARDRADPERPWQGYVRARGDSRPQRGGTTTFVEFIHADAGATVVEPLGFLESMTATPLREGEWRCVSGTRIDGGDGRNPGAPRLPARLIAGPEPASATTASATTPWPIRLRQAADRVGDRIDERLRATLSPAPSALARSLALGRSEGLDPRLRTELKQCGAWHLFAVSGSHVMLLAALLTWLLPRRPERLRRLLTAISVLGFALVCGAQPPAWRAAIGHSLHAIARLRLRRPCSATLLAATFLLLLALRPGLLFDAGTQLSFAAVFALLVAARHGPSRSPHGTGRGLLVWRPLLAALRCACFAGLATTPLTALHFGSIAWWAPLSTLLLAIPITVALVLSLVACALTPLPAGIAGPVARLLDPLLQWLERSLAQAAGWLAGLPTPPAPTATPSAMTLLCLGASWIALHSRRPALGMVTAALAMVATVVPSTQLAAPALAIDVGHGQALLLQIGDRRDLIDAGGRTPPASRTLVVALQALGVRRLDGLVLSHLDADHCGGAAEVLAGCTVDAVVVTADAARELAAATTGLTAALAAAISDSGCELRIAAAGDRFGPHRVVWPPPDRRFAARNDGSLALVTELPSGRLLLPGDLTGYPLIELAHALAREPAVDALLLPHHGNADPALSALLKHSRARRAFASRASRALPSVTEQALAAQRVVWWSTASQGALLFSPDGASAPGTASCEGLR